MSVNRIQHFAKTGRKKLFSMPKTQPKRYRITVELEGDIAPVVHGIRKKYGRGALTILVNAVLRKHYNLPDPKEG